MIRGSEVYSARFPMLQSSAFCILPIVLGFLTVIAVNETERFVSDASAGRIHNATQSPAECNWACHNNRSHCFDEHLYGLPEGLKKIVRGPVEWMMEGLRGGKNFRYYQLVNLLLLGIIWPLLLSIMIMQFAKRVQPLRRIRHTMIPTALIGLAALLSIYIFQTNCTSNSVKCLYDYLTEFILTLSHWSGVTYYDVNALLFIIMMPLLSVVLPGALVFTYLSKKSQSL